MLQSSNHQTIIASLDHIWNKKANKYSISMELSHKSSFLLNSFLFWLSSEVSRKSYMLEVHRWLSIYLRCLSEIDSLTVIYFSVAKMQLMLTHLLIYHLLHNKLLNTLSTTTVSHTIQFIESISSSLSRKNS